MRPRSSRGSSARSGYRPGAGQTVKARNQMLSFGTAGVLAEAQQQAHRSGIDAARLGGGDAALRSW